MAKGKQKRGTKHFYHSNSDSASIPVEILSRRQAMGMSNEELAAAITSGRFNREDRRLLARILANRTHKKNIS